jgi:hypothetical protein
MTRRTTLVRRMSWWTSSSFSMGNNLGVTMQVSASRYAQIVHFNKIIQKSQTIAPPPTLFLVIFLLPLARAHMSSYSRRDAVRVRR